MRNGERKGKEGKERKGNWKEGKDDRMEEKG